MKKIISTLALAAMLIIPVASYADKIGFVNLNLLFVEYGKASGIQKSFDDRFGAKQKELEKLSTNINALGKELKTNELMMTESKLEGSKKKLNSMLIEMRQKEMTFKNEVQEAQSIEMDKFRKIVFDIIKKYAEEKSFDLIIKDGAVAFVSPRVDVTNDILKLLNKPKSVKK